MKGYFRGVDQPLSPLSEQQRPEAGKSVHISEGERTGLLCERAEQIGGRQRRLTPCADHRLLHTLPPRPALHPYCVGV